MGAYNDMSKHLQNPGDFAGLAYVRLPIKDKNSGQYHTSGHVITVMRHEDKNLYAVDYQSGKFQKLAMLNPPEEVGHQSYHVFLRKKYGMEVVENTHKDFNSYQEFKEKFSAFLESGSGNAVVGYQKINSETNYRWRCF